MLEQRPNNKGGLAKEYLDFLLEKTYKTYIEAGSNVGKAFLTYLLLISLATLLVFGWGDMENQVKVPFLELSLNKLYAATIILVLSCGALYWFLSTGVLLKMLGFKIRWLIKERYGINKANNWNIDYPSPYRVFINMNAAHVGIITGLSFMSFFLFLIISSSLLPLILAWFIGTSFGFPVKLKLLLCLGVFILETPSLSMLYSLRRTNIETLVRDLDNEENQKGDGSIPESKFRNL
jgi:hypothetical protein